MKLDGHRRKKFVDTEKRDYSPTDRGSRTNVPFDLHDLLIIRVFVESRSLSIP